MIGIGEIRQPRLMLRTTLYFMIYYIPYLAALFISESAVSVKLCRGKPALVDKKHCLCFQTHFRGVYCRSANVLLLVYHGILG